MYEFINTGEKRYTEYLKCSNPTDSMQNQVSQKQNEDSDWSDDWDKSYVTDDIDNSPPTIEDFLTPYLLSSKECLIDEFYEKMAVISEENYQDYRKSKYENCTRVALKRLDCLIDEYLKKGIKFNLLHNKYEYTVSNLIFQELIKIANRVIEITPTTRSRIDPATGEDALNELTDTDSFDILISIVNKLLLAGAKVKPSLYDQRAIDMYDNDKPILEKFARIKNKLKKAVQESIVGGDKQAESFKVEIDNIYLLIECSKNSSIEVARITNSKISRDLNVKESILKIGDDIVKVEKVGKKRNYMDVVGNGVVISFLTKIGDVRIHLYPDIADSNKIKVKLDEESQAKIDKLQDKSIMNKSFFLGGKKVLEAIKDENFERNGSVPTKLSETIEQSNNAKNKRKIPSSFMEKVCNVKKLFCGSSVDKT